MGPPHYLTVFYGVNISALFMSASCCRKTLFLFCSNGVKSGVMKILRTGSGLSLDRSLSLCLRILALSWVELSEIFKSLDLSDRLPKRIAFWIVTVTPKYFWNNELHLVISSPFLEAPSLYHNQYVQHKQVMVQRLITVRDIRHCCGLGNIDGNLIPGLT